MEYFEFLVGFDVGIDSGSGSVVFPLLVDWQNIGNLSAVETSIQESGISIQHYVWVFRIHQKLCEVTEQKANAFLEAQTPEMYKTLKRVGYFCKAERWSSKLKEFSFAYGADSVRVGDFLRCKNLNIDMRSDPLARVSKLAKNVQSIQVRVMELFCWLMGPYPKFTQPRAFFA